MLLGVLLITIASPVPAQDNAVAQVSLARNAKFISLPFLPRCMQVALIQGDPRQGASVELAKIAPHCVIAPHWHAAATRLIFINGYGLHRLSDG
jgi:hypothetical protein